MEEGEAMKTLTLAELGIVASSIEEILPTYINPCHRRSEVE